MGNGDFFFDRGGLFFASMALSSRLFSISFLGASIGKKGKGDWENCPEEINHQDGILGRGKKEREGWWGGELDIFGLSTASFGISGYWGKKEFGNAFDAARFLTARVFNSEGSCFSLDELEIVTF